MHTIPIPIEVEKEEYIPLYATPQASGADLRAAIAEPLVLAPKAMVAVPTGIKVAIPDGYEIQVRPRSGLAAKNGLTVLNTPGTVDADYRGEIKVLLINLGVEPFTVVPGMRIAQLVVAPVVQAVFIPQQEPLSATVRGGGGFGHTGTN